MAGTVAGTSLVGCRCLVLARRNVQQAKGLEIKQHLYNSPDQKVCFILCLVTINKPIKQ